MKAENKAVLFIHGIAGSPRQFDLFYPELPPDMEQKVLLLAGHGGSVDDFARGNMKSWQAQVDQAIGELSRQHDDIYIVAHSMGTLFALQRSRNEKVKALFLLAVPLRVRVRIRPFLRNIHRMVLAGKKEEKSKSDPCSGVQPDWRFWKYLKWIPNYWALLKEIRRSRKLISGQLLAGRRVRIFQSAQDELVSPKAFACLQRLGCSIERLEHSQHHRYSQEDRERLILAFREWLELTDAAP